MGHLGLEIFFTPKTEHLLFLQALTPSQVTDSEHTQHAVLSCDMIISLRSDTTRTVIPSLMPQFVNHDLIYLNSEKQLIPCLGERAAVSGPSWNPTGWRPLRDDGWYMCHCISSNVLRHILLYLAMLSIIGLEGPAMSGRLLVCWFSSVNLPKTIGWTAMILGAGIFVCKSTNKPIAVFFVWDCSYEAVSGLCVFVFLQINLRTDMRNRWKIFSVHSSLKFNQWSTLLLAWKNYDTFTKI